MIRLDSAVVVEGRYDKIKLSGILDCLIVTTEGFSIFKDEEKKTFLKKLAEERGLVILTDSDSAGFMIRNYVENLVGKDKVRHVYLPDVFGKEKRKTLPGKEGKLGVEGMDETVILGALESAGILSAERAESGRDVTTADLFALGLSGGENSRAGMSRLLERLDLPQRLNKNSLLRYINSTMTYEEFMDIAGSLGYGENKRK